MNAAKKRLCRGRFAFVFLGTMKIGIDASLAIGERAGVGFYTSSLIEALASIDKHNQYVLYPFFYHIFDPRFKQLKAPASNFSVRFKQLPETWVRYLWFR